MVTQFHTLLHFVTLFPMILSPTASVAASIRIAGVSKSHLLSIYAYKRIHTNPVQRGLYTHAILDLSVYGLQHSVKNYAVNYSL
jgi:hypothetical protein